MTHHVLAIDDDPVNLTLLEEFLGEDQHRVTTFDAAGAALAWLEGGGRPDVVLVDRMMPELDGLAFVRRFRAEPRWRDVPVIMQTAAAAPTQIAEGLEAGVYYYLTKPFSRGLLSQLVRRALRERKPARPPSAQGLRGLERCRFRFRTLEDVVETSAIVASMCPDPATSLVGVRELMINAVEHGNLGITYDEKSRFIDEGVWDHELQRRLALPENRDRFAHVDLLRTDSELRIVIQDCGPGFDWRPHLEADLATLRGSHGRGIAIAKMMSFDDLEFVEPGNRVVCRKRL